MRGYRFYADYDNAAHKRRDTVAHRSTLEITPAPAGNVVALSLEDVKPLRAGSSAFGNGDKVSGPFPCFECVEATFAAAESPSARRAAFTRACSKYWTGRIDPCHT